MSRLSLNNIITHIIITINYVKLMSYTFLLSSSFFTETELMLYYVKHHLKLIPDITHLGADRTKPNTRQAIHATHEGY